MKTKSIDRRWRRYVTSIQMQICSADRSAAHVNSHEDDNTAPIVGLGSPRRIIKWRNDGVNFESSNSIERMICVVDLPNQFHDLMSDNRCERNRVIGQSRKCIQLAYQRSYLTHPAPDCLILQMRRRMFTNNQQNGEKREWNENELFKLFSMVETSQVSTWSSVGWMIADSQLAHITNSRSRLTDNVDDDDDTDIATTDRNQIEFTEQKRANYLESAHEQ